MSNEATRAATGEATRVEGNVAGLGGDRFPDRITWATQRRTVYGDDLDKVTDAVTADPNAYATRAEITRAADELGTYWRTLGQKLREANQAALAVWPLHGHRARRRASIYAILRERDRLSDADKAVIEHAEALKHQRKLVNDAVDDLHASRLHEWTAAHAERWMPRDACPTWRAILRRWREARGQAATDFAEAVQHRPVDDTAWSRELARRVEIEEARLNGHLRRRL